MYLYNFNLANVPWMGFFLFLLVYLILRIDTQLYLNYNTLKDFPTVWSVRIHPPLLFFSNFMRSLYNVFYSIILRVILCNLQCK